MTFEHDSVIDHHMIDTFIVIIFPFGTYSTLSVSATFDELIGGGGDDDWGDEEEEKVVDEDEDLSEDLLDESCKSTRVLFVVMSVVFALLMVFVREILGLDLAFTNEDEEEGDELDDDAEVFASPP